MRRRPAMLRCRYYFAMMPLLRLLRFMSLITRRYAHVAYAARLKASTACRYGFTAMPFMHAYKSRV